LNTGHREESEGPFSPDYKITRKIALCQQITLANLVSLPELSEILAAEFEPLEGDLCR
jgi:hypothetical protein